MHRFKRAAFPETGRKSLNRQYVFEFFVYYVALPFIFGISAEID